MNERVKLVRLGGWVGVLVLALGCCAKRIPLPKHLEVVHLEELEQRLRAAAVPATAFTAEVRLTYFGEEGRLRATASLAAQRPASLRYELQGPHGGVLQALATNGRELQFADLKAARFLYGRATPAVLDQLLGLVPLGLGPEGWVGLLFGELAVPASASLSYDDRCGRFVMRWSQGELSHQVEIDPQTSRVASARVERGDQLVSEVQIEERDARGLPVQLRLRVMTPPSDVEIRLRDVDYEAEFADAVFRLDPPRGTTPERLEELP